MVAGTQWRCQRSKGAISRSENPPARSPGYTFFLRKIWRPFLVIALKTQAANAVSPSNLKQIKRSDMVTLLFSVHTITEAKQYAGRSQGLSQGGGSSCLTLQPKPFARLTAEFSFAENLPKIAFAARFCPPNIRRIKMARQIFGAYNAIEHSIKRYIELFIIIRQICCGKVITLLFQPDFVGFIKFG